MLESKTLTVQEEGELCYITIPAFEKTGLVRHCFTTRLGGVSPEPYGMNLGISGADAPENVRRNYERIAYAIGSFLGNLVVSAQVHGTEILRVGVLDRGKGVVFPREMEAIDGLITDRSQVGLVTIHADCVPLFFLDPRRKAIGLAHAGWRGTVGKIGAKMIRRMQEDFGSDPADLLAAIGPSIGPCCFEVGEEVAKQFESVFMDHRAELIRPAKSSGKFYVDLWEANRQTMLSEGVLPEHITVTDLCTACHSDVFHSHRKTKSPGRMAAILELI